MTRRCFCVLLLVLGSITTSGQAGEPLPSTKPLEGDGDFASEMVAGIDRFLLAETEKARAARPATWKIGAATAENLEKYVAPLRQRLAKSLGVVDPRTPFRAPEIIHSVGVDPVVATGKDCVIHAIRWPVFRGVTGEGLLLTPTGREAVGDVVFLPDADQTPEMATGLVPGIAPEDQVVRRLVQRGFRVVVPLLIDRSDEYSITFADVGTNQPHREFVYRPAFEMGRHIIGYETQKVLALVDWLDQDEAKRPIGVYGYAEGGLLALCTGALDSRIAAVGVSGYFGPRENLWQEPIYRNVFRVLDQMGDAELAAMIAPRRLVVENRDPPAVSGPPKPRQGRRGGAAPGEIKPVDPALAARELVRAGEVSSKLLQSAITSPKETPAWFLFSEALQRSDREWPSARPKPAELSLEEAPAKARLENPGERMRRQLHELLEDTQHVMREGEFVRRRDFWGKLNTASLETYKETITPQRERFYNDVIGRFEQPLLPPNPRTRQTYDHEKYVGYEVQLDVFPDVFAYGLLFLPKDLKPGEKRPVVVCQHGLEGRPQHVIGEEGHAYYKAFATELANRGFITYAPQNPYIFTDRFRTLQRKANPLGKSLFSIIVPQHQQLVNWLQKLPMVDPQRVGFYGLSYGGKTAMRVPALVENYALSICSADFNEWVWKNASLREPFSYVGTGEYEIFEFDMGNTMNYAEMAALICPRPFMVERGHHDGVGIDEWVNYEFAKIRRHYTGLKIVDRTTIEHFDGPHTINGVGSYQFLEQHLSWPAVRR